MEIANPTLCDICNQPFSHKTRVRRLNGDTAYVVRHELITTHPICRRNHIKMERIKAKLIKTKKTLHTLRAEQLNLEFQMFVHTQCASVEEDMEDVFVIQGTTFPEPLL